MSKSESNSEEEVDDVDEEALQVTAIEDGGEREPETCEEIPRKVLKLDCYIGKNKYCWNKNAPSNKGRLSKRNIVSGRPGPQHEAKNIKVPIDGWDLLFDKRIIDLILKHTNEEIERRRSAYGKFLSSPYYGVYAMRVPMLFIRDPEVISIVMTKEFSHFRDRTVFVVDKSDVLSQNLFALTGDKWRVLRVKLSPVFTSGKLKTMFKHFIDCSEVLNSYLLDHADSEVDIKEISARFTTDVICNCAFGLEMNTLANPDNAMRKIGLKSLKFSSMTLIKIFLTLSFPILKNHIKIRFTPEDVEKFILKTITDVIHHRERTKGKRNDFIDLLLQLRDKGLSSEGVLDEEEEDQTSEPFEMTEGIMAAQCFVFFFAGFETSSSVQTFCLFELAINPEMQRRLQKEIDDMIERHGGLTYEAIKGMTYLTMVVSETLRKYPTLPSLNRTCTKELTLPDGLTIEKGDFLFIPVWALHHDPQHFPDPERFDPERFSEENIDSIRPYTYLPFGEGPRFCIGKRFGLLQTKMGVITILRKFSVELSEKMKLPLKFKPMTTTLTSIQPIKLKLKPRNIS